MNIETAIAQLTQTIEENNRLLTEILQAGSLPASGAAEPAAKKNAKKTTPTPAQVEARDKIEKILEQDSPITAEALEKETGGSDLDIEPEQEETASIDPVTVPDLPIAELRAELKKTIKDKMFADPKVKAVFEATRKKYNVNLVGELTDDQVPQFYKEVISW
jgi:hypothetical protein